MSGQSSTDTLVKAQGGGFTTLMGLKITSMVEGEVVAELVVGPQHHQPMGIVHGGVYCAIVETICSMGGFVYASKRGNTVVGLDNQTSFLKATRSGTLRAVAKPLTTGARTQLWEAHIHNEAGELVSTGRVRLLCIDASKKLAGEVPGGGSSKG
jgi:1,4-dihydroxy-2-naphthoyl-CoA hydrolase